MNASPEMLAAWASEMRLKVEEDETYLETLRRKGKPKEMLDLMEVRLDLRRGLRDYLTSCEKEAEPAVADLVKPVAEPGPSTKRRSTVEWDDE